jgi:hypothetical protein
MQERPEQSKTKGNTMTIIEHIVTAMIDYNIDEQNTVGELLHAIRVGEKDTDIPDREWIDHPRFGRVTPLLQEDTR